MKTLSNMVVSFYAGPYLTSEITVPVNLSVEDTERLFAKTLKEALLFGIDRYGESHEVRVRARTRTIGD